MDLAGFLTALWADWLALVTGIGSLVLTVSALYRPTKRLGRFRWLKSNQRTLFGILAVGCFVIASVRVWTTEHKKVLGQVAYMSWMQRHEPQNMIMEVGKEIRLPFAWKNVGTAPANRAIALVKPYLASGDMPWTEKQYYAVEQFKRDWMEFQADD